MKKRIIIFTFLFPLLVISCNKKERTIISQGEISLKENNEDISEKNIQTQIWQTTNQKIAILFGYGFNSEEFIEETLTNLNKKFGLTENGGLIEPIIYPDDLKNGTKPHISLFRRKLYNLNLKGVIILGAPEGTSSSLSVFQDSYETDFPFPVISAFSQDDVLQTEYVSTIVIDKALIAEMDGNLNSHEEEQPMIKNIQEFICNSVNFCKNTDSKIQKDATLLDFAKKIGGNNKVIRYSDIETGLYSLNHFYIQ